MNFGRDIARAWMEYGRSHAKHKSLWDGSLALATIGPQPVHPTKAIDFSGRKNHGTLTNGPTWENGSLRGQAFPSVRFDGSDDVILTTRPFVFGTGSFSYCQWLKPTSGTVLQISGSTFNVSPGVWLGLDNRFGVANQLAFHCGDSTNAATRGTTQNAYVAGQWVCFVGCWDASQKLIRIFANEVEQSTTVTQSTGGSEASITSSDTALPLRIGTYEGGIAPFNGAIGSNHVFGRLLTTAEIATLATYPLAAYEVEVPHYYFVGGTAATHLWPWQIRRMRRTAGAR